MLYNTAGYEEVAPNKDRHDTAYSSLWWTAEETETFWKQSGRPDKTKQARSSTSKLAAEDTINSTAPCFWRILSVSNFYSKRASRDNPAISGARGSRKDERTSTRQRRHFLDASTRVQIHAAFVLDSIVSLKKKIGILILH